MPTKKKGANMMNIDSKVYTIVNDQIEERTIRSFDLHEEAVTPKGIRNKYEIGDDAAQKDNAVVILEWSSQGARVVVDNLRDQEAAQSLIDRWDYEYFRDYAGEHGISYYLTREEAEEALAELNDE